MDKNKRAVYVDSAVTIGDLIEIFGSIPQSFASCIVCKQEAKFILCCRDDELSDKMPEGYAEQAAEALSQYLRAEFGTNFEISVCEQHLEDPQ